VCPLHHEREEEEEEWGFPSFPERPAHSSAQSERMRTGEQPSEYPRRKTLTREERSSYSRWRAGTTNTTTTEPPGNLNKSNGSPCNDGEKQNEMTAGAVL